jgi:hypothetical protein
MTRYFKLIIALVFSAIITLDSFAQNPESFLDKLAKNFQNYCSTYPWEDIYLHTDRNNYAAGEDIWFAVYSFDRQSLKPETQSRIAYVEVLNSARMPVAQKRVLLDHATGSGRITLPDTLRSGPCILRAYTNYMKNFLPANCFTMEINVFNAVSDSQYAGNRIIEPVEKGNDGTKYLVNQQVSGFVTEILTANPDTLILNIGTTRELRSREGSVCYLFVETRGNINFRQTVNLLSNKTTVRLPCSFLTPGINHFTLFNESGVPVAEKFTYTPGRKPGKIEIGTNDNYRRREKITVDLTFGREILDSANASHFSLAAIPVTGKTFPDMSGYLTFGSEFGLLPDNLVRSVVNRNDECEVTDLLPVPKSYWIDWKAIISGKWPSIKYLRETEDHFLYGKLVNKRSGLPDPDQFLFLSIPGKNANFQYSLTDKNGDFSFRVPIDDYTRDLIIQPEKPDRNNTIRAEKSFSDVYPGITYRTDSLASGSSVSLSKLKINFQVGKIYSSGGLLPAVSHPVPPGEYKRFYGKPDYELVMDDYIKLPVMQEVFFELLPGVTLKSKKSKSEIIITDPVEYKPFDNPPTLLVDGVVINDPDIIANMDPELVEKIDVVRERYFVGDYLFYGILNVITRAGNFSNVTLPDYAVRLNFETVEPSEPFTSPDYSSSSIKQGRIPDFRNTLYWNPSVKVDGKGKAKIEFWSSDFVSEYEIIVQGLSGDGKPCSAKKVISITNQ